MKNDEIFNDTMGVEKSLSANSLINAERSNTQKDEVTSDIIAIPQPQIVTLEEDPLVTLGAINLLLKPYSEYQQPKVIQNLPQSLCILGASAILAAFADVPFLRSAQHAPVPWLDGDTLFEQIFKMISSLGLNWLLNFYFGQRALYLLSEISKNKKTWGFLGKSFTNLLLSLASTAIFLPLLLPLQMQKAIKITVILFTLLSYALLHGMGANEITKFTRWILTNLYRLTIGRLKECQWPELKDQRLLLEKIETLQKQLINTQSNALTQIKWYKQLGRGEEYEALRDNLLQPNGLSQTAALKLIVDICRKAPLEEPKQYIITPSQVASGIWTGGIMTLFVFMTIVSLIGYFLGTAEAGQEFRGKPTGHGFSNTDLLIGGGLAGAFLGLAAFSTVSTARAIARMSKGMFIGIVGKGGWLRHKWSGAERTRPILDLPMGFQQYPILGVTTMGVAVPFGWASSGPSLSLNQEYLPFANQYLADLYNLAVPHINQKFGDLAAAGGTTIFNVYPIPFVFALLAIKYIQLSRSAEKSDLNFMLFLEQEIQNLSQIQPSMFLASLNELIGVAKQLEVEDSLYDVESIFTALFGRKKPQDIFGQSALNNTWEQYISQLNSELKQCFLEDSAEKQVESNKVERKAPATCWGRLWSTEKKGEKESLLRGSSKNSLAESDEPELGALYNLNYQKE